MDVHGEAIPVLAVGTNQFTGRKSAIGATPVQLTTTATRAIKTLWLTNQGTETVYVGFSNAITADSADGTDGFPILAGSSPFPIMVEDASDVWVRATSAGKIWFMGY